MKCCSQSAMFRVELALQTAEPKSQRPRAVARRGAGRTRAAPTQSETQRCWMSRKLTERSLRSLSQMLCTTRALMTRADSRISRINKHCTGRLRMYT